ncbi:MAG: drug/metabolite exporter YedA [Archangium sp.]|nr:drug/metabolite exporter YedA [Archangium sp.]
MSTAPATNTRLVVPALAAVYLIWGSTYLAMRVAVEGLPPFMMASTRFILTGLILLAFLRLRGTAWPTRREWWYATPVGTLMFVLGNGTVAVAEKHISSGVAAVVCGTMPLWVAALGRFFGEKTTSREWLALVLGFGGVAVLGFGGELRAEPFSALILFLAPISWALGSLLARRLPLAKGLMSAATQMLTGGLVMSVVSVIARERVPVSPPASSVIAWAYLAVFGSLVAYSAYTYLLANARPAVATSYAYVNPVIAVAMGVGLGGEHAGPEVFIAVALIVAATVLVIRKPAPVLESPTLSTATSK